MIRSGWRYYRIVNNRLVSPFVGTELPRDGELTNAYYIPLLEDIWPIIRLMRLTHDRHDIAMTFGEIHGPLARDRAWPESMQSARYQARVILTDDGSAPALAEFYAPIPVVPMEHPTMLKLAKNSLATSPGA
ncbi:hypothetical protein A5633_14390 [Mycolicibacterium elephantis]|uniref:hypothetical protein n=1 Tax=Mycolicibacterium elephantis TaxID=81858 RepID=UPI0007E9F48C|nr:hypothetical protein [Mycolicibacterium elephantis]OBA83457.1 hypothetical protein A5633_14390 [Mycolicibacterium elephantis]